MSMAAKLSDLVGEMSGVNLQMKGHADMPPQSAKDLWEPETETEELGAVPHPLILGWPPHGQICCMMLGLDSPKQW